MKKICILVGVMLMVMIMLSMSIQKVTPYKEKLSQYGLFVGELHDQTPAGQVMFYELNAPLFSDYAYKLRFVRLPEGQHVEYNSDSVFQFPVGTVIAKTFFYYHDERDTAKGRKLLETRILLNEQGGWKSLPYIWNEEQTEAYLEVAGATALVNYLDKNGTRRSLEYLIPNMNQCKSCHERNGLLSPIGPSARQLNRDIFLAGKKLNQLEHWSASAALHALPVNKREIPFQVNYEDASAPLRDRARAYLDINCAHCHNKSGSAQTSGLFLDWKTEETAEYGIYKTPIAAGRGSGNLKYDITPGKPAESILWYRMTSSDPGIMMPELGRRLKHEEGIRLISEWIKTLKSE